MGPPLCLEEYNEDILSAFMSLNMNFPESPGCFVFSR